MIWFTPFDIKRKLCPHQGIFKDWAFNYYLELKQQYEEALAIRRKFYQVDMITKAQFSNSPNDFKIRLFG